MLIAAIISPINTPSKPSMYDSFKTNKTLKIGKKSYVISSLKEMSGGEIFIPKIPSMKVTDIAKAIAPDLKQKYIGMQPGEKLAECLISSDESNITYELNDRFLIINNDLKKKISQAKQWKKVKTGFNYSSDTNKLWLSNSDIHDLISEDNAKKNL